MIWGIGTDLIDVRRIEKVLNRYGDRLWNRILNCEEREGLREKTPLILAKRFAAKEACAKALGTGISAALSWHDMTIVHGLGKPPQIRLSQSFLDKFYHQTEPGDSIKLDLSLSDEYPYVQTFVVVSLERMRGSL